MREEEQKHLPVWILPQLWGLDVPVAVLFWTLIAAEYLQITMMSEGPILVVVVMTWVCTIVSRVYSAVVYKTGWYHRYYETRAVPMLLMALSAAAAAVWMLLYYVSLHAVGYMLVPAAMLGGGIVFRTNFLSGLSKAMALGFACMAPAFALSFMYSPMGMLYCSPCWYLGVLFFLFMREKARWEHEEEGAADVSGLLVAGLFLLLVCNSLSFLSAESPEQHALSFTIVTAAACLMVLAKMRSFLRRPVLFGVCWSVMAFAPILGMLLFSRDSSCILWY